MRSTAFNPYTWDYSRTRVDSDVLSLDIKDDKGNVVNVSHLTSNINIQLPLHPKNHTPDVFEHFAKPAKLHYHVTRVDYEGTVIKIEIKPQTPKARYTIYVKYQQRPTTDNYDVNQTVSSNCNSRDTGKYDCVTDYFQVTAQKPGPYYIGILGERIPKHKRVIQRKRSPCVEVKDPPPTPPSYKNVTVTPEYDPLTDVNYTLRVRLGSCVYWSQVQEKWITDGCKVRHI